MTVAAENVLPLDPGDLLGSIVKEENLPVHIMGQDPFLEAVEDGFEIFPVCDAFEDHDIPVVIKMF